MINIEKEEFLNKCKNPEFVQNIVDNFHKLYYYSSAFGMGWKNNFWLGIPIQKNPLDVFVYQELIFAVKPDIIIETGTKIGGSALFFATILDAINKGEVITIDIDHAEKLPQHKRITYLIGNSTDEDIINFISSRVKDKKVMVILDSDHSKEHVLKELKIYSDMVTVGSYLITEDTNCSGHPVKGIEGEGPLEAVFEFMNFNTNFKIDRNWEKNFFSFNPCGFLKRIK